jgi:hypothetical protein
MSLMASYPRATVKHRKEHGARNANMKVIIVVLSTLLDREPVTLAGHEDLAEGRHRQASL